MSRLAREFVHAWGHAFDDYGVSFATDGANKLSIDDFHFLIGATGTKWLSRRSTRKSKVGNRKSHVAFRPIDVKMGPDGALDIADWYNPIIQHGEVDFRDPRRDHTHGRIWRVTAKNRPLVPRPKLVGATVPELLEHLKAPERSRREFML